MKKTILTLALMKGLPLAVGMFLIAILLKRLGLSNSEVTLMVAFFFSGWVVRPLWRPVIDTTLTRRTWVIITEICLTAVIYAFSVEIETKGNNGVLFLLILCLSFVGSTHDVAVTNFLIENDKENVFNGCSYLPTVFKYIPMIVTLGILIMVVGNLEVITRRIESSWSTAFLSIAIFSAVLTLFHFFMLKRRTDLLPVTLFLKPQQWKKIILGRSADLLGRKRIILLIGLMLICLMPQMLHFQIANLFLIERSRYGGLGLTPQDYSFVIGTIGVAVFIICNVVFQYLLSNKGNISTFLLAAALYSSASLPMLYLSNYAVRGFWVLCLLVCIQSAGWAAGITMLNKFVNLVSRGRYSAAHRGMIWAMINFALMVNVILSGFLQTTMGYTNFFILTSVLGLLPLAIFTLSIRHIKHYITNKQRQNI